MYCGKGIRLGKTMHSYLRILVKILAEVLSVFFDSMVISRSGTTRTSSTKS